VHVVSVIVAEVARLQEATALRCPAMAS